MLQVCVNGSRTAAEHVAVPTTPPALTQDAAALAAAGVKAIHVHARNAAGQESLTSAAVAATLQAIRSVAPTVEIALSTAAGIAASPAERLRLLESWTSWPDILCVNLSEEGIGDVIELAQERGVQMEAGLFTPQDVKQFGKLEAYGWRRTLLEPQSTNPAQAEAEANALLKEFAALNTEVPALLHGMDTAAWPILCLAGKLGLRSRIGFEDVLVGPESSPVEDNAKLYQLGLLQWKNGHQ